MIIIISIIVVIPVKIRSKYFEFQEIFTSFREFISFLDNRDRKTSSDHSLPILQSFGALKPFLPSPYGGTDFVGLIES